MLYRLEAVRVRLGGQIILDGADFQHNPGEHLALVGRNGSGKTTLLRLLSGELEADTGHLRFARDLRAVTLKQHFAAAPGTTVLHHALGAFEHLHQLERELGTTAEELAHRPDDELLLERLQELQDAIEMSALYRTEAEARSTLAAFGLGEKYFDHLVEALSGGQRTRLALVRAMLAPGDLLLLDEPTNHLDLFGAQALAENLSSHPGAVLVATHDRELIDRVAHQVVEVENGRLKRWPAGYQRYLEAKNQAVAADIRAWERQQEQIQKTETFIRKNIAGQKTRQAQSRRRELERMERLERPAAAEPAPAFVWREVPRSGDVVLAAEKLTAGYGGTPVVSAGQIVLRRGERIAVLGPNGAGKTTLLSALAGKLPPLGGKVTLGHNVMWGWYDQELADLPAEGTVLDVLWDGQPRWSPQEVRSWAARFGFSGDMVELEIFGLSGGERGRLTLARMLASGPNLLFLDEPTNHLDLPTCEALEEALLAFPGSLLLVSHDRRLLDRVASKVLLVARGTVEEFSSVAAAMASTGDPSSRSKPRQETAQAKGSRRSPLAAEARKIRSDVEKLRRHVAELEVAVDEHHATITQGEASLADRQLWNDPPRLREIQDSIEAAREELEGLEEAWTKAAADLEALEARLTELEQELGSP